MYLVTKQLGSSAPHERELFEERDRAVFEAMQLSGLHAPGDLEDDEWERTQGNQHKPTRWRHWHQTQTGRVVNVYIRKFNVGEAS